jgi:hypothetical protein
VVLQTYTVSTAHPTGTTSVTFVPIFINRTFTVYGATT